MDWATTLKKSTAEWDLWAVIGASLIAIVLHLLHLLPEEVVVTLILLLIALHALHEMGHVVESEETAEAVRDIKGMLREQNEFLVEPHSLEESAEAMARKAAFDVLLRPAIDNRKVDAVRVVVDSSLEEDWREIVAPKVDSCDCSSSGKISTVFDDLDENVAFTLIDLGSPGHREGQISVWGEPFMMEVPGAHVPRHVLHLKPDSSLIPRLVEMFRRYSA